MTAKGKTIRKIMTSRQFWMIVSLLALLHVAVFDLRIIRAPDTLQVQYTPDDAYYYLELAKNFSTMGCWTFDSGFSTASGFHPLLAYLLSLLYRSFRPTISQFVHCGLIVSSLIAIFTALLIWISGLGKNRPYYMLFLTLLISSKNYAYNSVSLMEWPLVILFASLYCILFYRSYSADKKDNLVILFLLGLFGSLSRSDFGFLPFSLFLASSMLFRFSRNKGAVLRSVAGVLGATLGVLLIFVQNQVFTGHFLQSSAKTKVYWEQLYGVAYRGAMHLVAEVLGIEFLGSRLLTVVLIMGMGGILLFIAGYVMRQGAFRLRHSNSVPSLRELTMVIAASLSIAGYTFLYSHIRGIQPWYTANLMVPVFILLFVVAGYIDKAIKSNYQEFMTLGVSIIVMVVMIVNITSIHNIGTFNSPWPHQQIMLKAGNYLGQHALDGKVGSWNAGIIGYYQGGTVINIDGLVNNEIYDYAVGNKLPSYLSQKGIKYVIDFDNMFNDKKYRLRGGYDDASFLSSLRPIHVFDDGQYGWKHLTLYRIVPRTLTKPQ
jgi:hypothetical protein